MGILDLTQATDSNYTPFPTTVQAGENTMETAMTITAQQDQLLLATLGHVAFDGWTRAALRHGATDLALPEGTADCLFPQGITDVIRHLEDWADRAMQTAWGDMATAPLKVHDKVALAVRLRLTALAPYREALRRLPGYHLARLEGGQLSTAVWHTCDQVWRLAGDTATDFNYYTKRALLAAAYIPTVLYWLQDTSDEMTATWTFLDRRLQNVMQLPKLTAPVKRTCQEISHAAHGVCSQLRHLVPPRLMPHLHTPRSK
jgi:ubiquinone biosynthesis protein COQ9